MWRAVREGAGCLKSMPLQVLRNWNQKERAYYTPRTLAGRTIIAASGHGPQRGESQRGESECEGGISGAMSVAASQLVDRSCVEAGGGSYRGGRSHPNAVYPVWRS